MNSATQQKFHSNSIACNKKNVSFSLIAVMLCLWVSAQTNLQVSQNQRFFQTADGKPFFWLGDTGWLLFVKNSREDVIRYLDTRKQQGFNVIQAMVIHDVKNVNVYGDTALLNQDLSKPIVTAGNNFNDSSEYDFWDHVEFTISEAEKRDMVMALVPVWGSNVKDGKVTVEQAKVYANFLTDRFSRYPNIIWLNGGDIRGSDGYDVWQAIGATIKQNDKKHLMTFHPRGRYSSSDWFHNAPWLDFNMSQSGHRTYAQDTSKTDKHFFGEDNWRFIKMDYKLKPVKPTLDGEPSYENIPHGLHDYSGPVWGADDLRRYAYWSVFAGAAGFTYGENAVMQFYTKGDKDGNYNVKLNWKDAINAQGARQMQYLKNLMLEREYFSRVPAQEIIAENAQKRYNYILATKGKGYAMAYTYTGRTFKVNMGKLGFKPAKAHWFNPSTGGKTLLKLPKSSGIVSFDPPGSQKNGNDWVLILEN